MHNLTECATKKRTRDHPFCLNQDLQDYQDFTRIRQEMERKRVTFLSEPGLTGLHQDKTRDGTQKGSDILLGIEQAVIF